MDYAGIRPGYRSRLVKITQAINVGDLASLYGGLRDADTELRNAFTLFLAQNHLPGWKLALDFLTEVEDAMTACRAAAVCLLMTRIEGQE